MRRLLLAAALLFPGAASAEGIGLSAEGQGVAFLREDSQGGPFDEEWGWGLRLGYDVGRLVGVQAPLDLQVELLWNQSGSVEGTRAVSVERRIDAFALPARLGWAFTAATFRLVPYAAAGPALTNVSNEFYVLDPVAERTGVDEPQTESASGLEAGAVYGAGLATEWAIGRGQALGARIEALRLHRGPDQDLLLTMGLGFRL